MDLEDIVQVGFGAGAVFQDFVLVACYFETLLTLVKKGARNQLEPWYTIYRAAYLSLVERERHW